MPNYQQFEGHTVILSQYLNFVVISKITNDKIELHLNKGLYCN